MFRLRFISLLLMLCVGSYAFADELVIEVLDVGQADGILLRTQGKTVIIDAGETKEQMLGHLEDRGVSHIDLAVGTHPHADHIGGMQTVLENVSVGVYLDNGYPHTTVMYDRLMTVVEQLINAGQMRYRVARAGQRINFGTEAYFEVLAPTDNGFTGTRSDINANSIIMKLVHGENCFLFTGDAEAESERAILDTVGQCQVLKASHHGSKHSSVEEFLNVVQPQYALLSCGLANKHGHPSPETLERYEARNIKSFRTDLEGTITIVSDGKSIRIQGDHAPMEITKINVNLAGVDALRQLPGIGLKTAESIIEYRQINGPFAHVDDIVNVSDRPMNKKRLEKVIPFIVTEGGSTTGLTGAPSGPATTTHVTRAVVAKDIGNNLQINTQYFAGLTHKDKAQAIREVISPYGACAGITHIKGLSKMHYERRQSVCGAMHTGEHWANYFSVPLTAATTSYQAPSTPGLININTASEAELAKLPAISAAKARTIIEHRQAHGPFSDCARIVDVKGIGKKTYEKLASMCTVSGGAAPTTSNIAPSQATTQQSYAAMTQTADGRININIADAEQLSKMPGMSRVKAQKLVEDRHEKGFFSSCQDVVRVKGIGGKTMEKMLPQCTVQ